MKTILNEVVAMFDVDQTLVVWDSENKADVMTLPILNPYDKEWVNVKIHHAHVRLLKQMKNRGRHIVVWSAGGSEWAEAVVKALDIEDFVDQVMTKPIAYVDDLPVESWMQHRIYIPFGESK